MAATAQQVGRLAAGAKGGTAGVAAYDQAQAQVKASRDQAIGQLQQVAKQANAPGALTTQLAAGISAPAGVTLDNLASLGAASGAGSDANQAATGNYLHEAGAALPLIRAEADRDLGQKIALLNASRAGSGGGAGSLSDSELRTRLLGEATRLRAQIAGAQEQNVGSQAFNPGPLSGFADNDALRQALLAAGNPTAAAAVGPNSPVPNPLGGVQFQPFKTSRDDARRLAFENIGQMRYGPGITEQAAKIGIGAGIDEGRVRGVLPPSIDQAYVSANEKLGLYKDPNKASDVTGQTLDLQAAADQLKIPVGEAQSLAAKTHFVWSDPNSVANKGLRQFLRDPVSPGVYTAADGQNYDFNTPGGREKAQQAFMGQPNAWQDYATPIVSDVLADAKRAVDSGLDWNTWTSNLAAVPEYRYDPKSFQLAFLQALPLFQYAALLHSRQTTAPDQPVDSSLYATAG